MKTAFCQENSKEPPVLRKSPPINNWLSSNKNLVMSETVKEQLALQKSYQMLLVSVFLWDKFLRVTFCKNDTKWSNLVFDPLDFAHI